jgi:uncharacterized protein (TIGR02246 family)
VSRIEDIARRYWKAEESRDVAKIVRFFTEDADWTAPGLEARGRDQIGPLYAGHIALYPTVEVTLGRVLGDDDEAAIEWRADMTDNDGRPVSTTGINVMRREGDLIASLTVYMDLTQTAR